MDVFLRSFMPFLLITANSFSFIRSSFVDSPSPVNLSNFFYPKVTSLTESTTSPLPIHFFKGVLDVIAKKERWELEDIHVSQLDVNKAKSRLVHRYDFQIRLGKTAILVKMNEETSEWKRLESGEENKTSKLEDFIREFSSIVVIDSFKIAGPFDLLAAGDNDELSLILPLNKNYSGLRKISVSEDITLEIKGSDEISIFYTSQSSKVAYSFLSISHQHICQVFPYIRIRGLVSVVAYKTTRPTALIQSQFSSRDAIKLLPEKCYVWPKPHLSYFITQIPLLERLMGSFVNQRIINFTAAISSIKIITRASTMLRFPLELDHNVNKNDIYWSRLDEWRTRPIRERARFDVIARIEEGILKPIFVKRVRPLIDTVSYSWSSLLSNISFTKFPSLMVAPEALTLDVMW